MIGRLVFRHIALHPIRSIVFLGAYASGVAVMLALLSIGEVMVAQSRDEKWVGGGDVSVLPAGVDLETLRTGGAVFFGLEQARFVARSILDGPRLADAVDAVAPWIDDRAVYVRRAGSDAALAIRASGQIPSTARTLGAAPEVTSGEWVNSEADRLWLRPTPFELYSDIDRFHLPPASVRGDSTWAEWHYFNLLWPGEERWLYLSYILGGDLSSDRWGGLVLARLRTPDGRHRSFADTLRAGAIEFSTTSPDLRLGAHTVELLDEPARYRVQAVLPSLEGRSRLQVDLEIEPAPYRYFPPAQLASSDSFVSGYVVPALRARARGTVCWDTRCWDVDQTLAYHDHNWGTWGGVIWDWGVAHAGDLDVLYGGVHGSGVEEARRRGTRFLVYAVDSSGVAAVLEPDSLDYSGSQPVLFEGETVSVPERLTWTARRGEDSLTAVIDLQRIGLSRLSLGADADVFFAQMQGTMTLTGRLGSQPVSARGPGFFETYIRRR